MFQVIARQVECHGSDHQVRHHSLHLQVQKAQVFTNYVFCTAADRSPRFPRTTSKCTGSRQRGILCLHARLIEVNGRMTEKIRDLEQTVSGFKSDQCCIINESIDFSKIEADLTELKTLLYKAQVCLARAERTQATEA